MKLTTENNSEYIFSSTIYFIDESKGIKTEICKASNICLSNSPYDQDEFFSYSIWLFHFNDELYIKKEQGHRKGTENDVETEIYLSKDGGKNWAKTAEVPLNAVPILF
jgi:hypothetical protein